MGNRPTLPDDIDIDAPELDKRWCTYDRNPKQLDAELFLEIIGNTPLDDLPKTIAKFRERREEEIRERDKKNQSSGGPSSDGPPGDAPPKPGHGD